MLSSNFVLNCKVNADDVDRSIKIYGPPVPLLKGTMATPPQILHNKSSVSIPIGLLEKNKNFKMYCDICFIGGLPFLITKSDVVEFITSHFLVNRKKIDYKDLAKYYEDLF